MLQWFGIGCMVRLTPKDLAQVGLLWPFCLSLPMAGPELDEAAPTELDSVAPTELDSVSSEDDALVLPLLMDDTAHDASTPNGFELNEDGLADDRMNGGVMLVLSETQEADLRQAQQEPRVVWSVPDILAMQPQPNIVRVRSPAVLPPTDGMLAVAGEMHGRMVAAHSMQSTHVEWCLPQPNENHFDHCCGIIDNIAEAFYIGITGDPNGRWAQHLETQTVGPEPVMVVLIEAVSSHMTAALEVRLLDRYLHRIRCTNQSPGGEGASAASPHYLYVLRASSPLLRRGR